MSFGRRIGCAKSGSAFTTPDTNSYLYNARSELTNATAAVDALYRYDYAFDDIGNRNSASERGTNFIYTANQLNQYSAIDDFTPVYDADGNQTLVKTATGIWSVTYNGENRPILWTQGTNTIAMSFDRMGRRVSKNDQRFVYNGYLQIANFHSSTPTQNSNCFIWDPTEPIATRPLVWNFSTTQPSTSRLLFYTHDGNKNVSEVIASNGSLAAHYEYAPFGALTAQRGTSAADNPWRFSGEFADDGLSCDYYNYRHYEPISGRWMSRDPMEDRGDISLYSHSANRLIIDYLGRHWAGGAPSWIWPEDTCREVKKRFEKWYEREKQRLDERDESGKNWVERLPKCPQEMRKDGDDYISPDPDEWEKTWYFPFTQFYGNFHPGGKYELRTKNPSKYGGSGNQCIYDGCGKLIVTMPGAGTVDYSSPNGGRSHRDDDVEPFSDARNLDCHCGRGYVEKYHEVRPSW